MKLSQYVDVAKLNEMVAKGWISCRPHPTLPIRIYNYADPVHVLQDRTQEAFEAFWASHEVCACRGLIVDNEDNIIARPQYKFFNLGQKATIMSDGPYYGSLPSVDVNVVVDGFFLAEEAVNRSITITRKMDGMMGILWEYNGQWGISTRGSFESAGADFASEKWQKFVKYGATEFVPKDYTLIFEIIANHLRIVVPYNWEGLCLLTAVNKVTGEEMPYEQLKQVWENINQYAKVVGPDGTLVPGRPWCRLVEKVDISIDEAKADPSKEDEGYVVAINRSDLPPIKAKVKLAEYCRLHKLITNITPQAIWSELANPMQPWINDECTYDYVNKVNISPMPIPKEFRTWVLGWQDGLTKAFHEKLSEAILAMSKIAFVKSDYEMKKDLESVHGKELTKLIMLLRHGKIALAYQSIWKSVRPVGRDETFYVEGKGE